MRSTVGDNSGRVTGYSSDILYGIRPRTTLPLIIIHLIYLGIGQCKACGGWRSIRTFLDTDVEIPASNSCR